MRLFAATIATETNTFSPLPTSIDGYKECVFLRPGEHPDASALMCTAPLWVARRRAAAEGFTLIEGSCFAASPAGTTGRKDYEFMRDEILGQLEAALPVDGVLLGLHGAMVAHGYDDVEGDILERVRAIAGAKTLIGVELDPHCHLTLKRVRLADVIVLYKEFPHTDVVERAEDVLRLVLQTLRGEVKPVTSVYDCRSPEEVVDLLQGGQGVFGIAIGGAFKEIQGSLSHLPAERGTEVAGVLLVAGLTGEDVGLAVPGVREVQRLWRLRRPVSSGARG